MVYGGFGEGFVRWYQDAGSGFARGWSESEEILGGVVEAAEVSEGSDSARS